MRNERELVYDIKGDFLGWRKTWKVFVIRFKTIIIQGEWCWLLYNSHPFCLKSTDMEMDLCKVYNEGKIFG